RELFVSERRYIRNMLLRHRGVEVSTFPVVVTEEYGPVRGEPSGFNDDFALQFRERMTNFQTCLETILPNTLGADLCVTYDVETSQPLRTELMGGGAFSSAYYKRYIAEVEMALDRLSWPIDLRACAYCRVFVIEGDICFLAFPRDSSPVVRGATQILAAT